MLKVIVEILQHTALQAVKYMLQAESERALVLEELALAVEQLVLDN